MNIIKHVEIDYDEIPLDVEILDALIIEDEIGNHLIEKSILLDILDDISCGGYNDKITLNEFKKVISDVDNDFGKACTMLMNDEIDYVAVTKDNPCGYGQDDEW